MGKYPWHLRAKEEDPIEIDILNFMDSKENSSFLDDMPPLPTLTSQDVQSIIPSFTTNNENDFLVDSFFDCKPKLEPFNEDDDALSAFEPRILQVTNYQEPMNSNQPMQTTFKQEIQNNEEAECVPSDEIVEEISYEEKYKCKPSLFKTTRATEKYPWEMDFVRDEENNDDFTGDKNIELMNEYEENEIYKRLKTIFDASHCQQIEIPSWIRRHYRKLCVRKTQRSLGLPVFNVDKFNKFGQNKCDDDKSKTIVLDRFHHLITSAGSKVNETFMARLAGSCQYELFVSPHTERVLHPFIYRNDSCVPPWVKLMCELQYEVNGTMPNRASIDFCYVRPQHIAAVNSLLQRMFWPGIDSKF